jgi:uncharacterized glyoxalase superfamily protein PhnB
MLHVPDVRSTIDWYTTIGFKALRHNEEDGEINWASLSFGDAEVMFNAGGKPSTHHRREVDLYVLVENVDGQYQRIKGRGEIVEEPHNTFYGMREFTVRDINRFWITFGEPVHT